MRSGGVERDRDICRPSGSAHEFVFGDVRLASAAQSNVRNMMRDSFYFLLALAGLVIVIGWLVFVTFAE